MRDILIQKLHRHLLQSHPDLLVSLQEGAHVTAYLEERMAGLGDLPETLLFEGSPAYIVEELCMEALTKDMPPSRFNYLSSILHEEFEAEYYAWLKSGILTYEIINILQEAVPVFEHFGFGEQIENDRPLRYAIIGTVRQYLDGD
jgi:hypothetical protein